jgi:hypothetical protein
MQSRSSDANSELRANCYECAFRLIHRYFGGNPHVCKIPEPVWDKFDSLLTLKSKVMLVHGSVFTLSYGGCRIDHAWIEVKNPGESVKCFHWQSEDRAVVADRRSTDRTHRRHTVIEAVTMGVTNETYGPWGK